jgi:hypothetical protein
MMPVPTHLRDCVSPTDPALDESELVGTARCLCGSQESSLLFPGQTQEFKGGQFPCTAEIDGSFFFLIRALCTVGIHEVGTTPG